MVFYFFKKLLFSFSFFYIAILSILSLGDLLFRLTLLPSLQVVPIIIVLMIPLLSVFAIPIATCLSVNTTIGTLHDLQEITLVYYLPKLRKQFFSALLLFTIFFPTLYIPLVFEWAPATYFSSKKYMAFLAKERFIQLEPGKFHTFWGKFSFFFRDKQRIYHEEDANYKSHFFNIVLSFEQEGRQYLISAQEGYFNDSFFILYNGQMHTHIENGKTYVVTFQKNEFLMDTLWDFQMQENQSNKNLKYLQWKELYNSYGTSPAFNFEMHIRIVRVLWQLFFPLISALIMLLLIGYGSSLLTSFLVTIGSVFVSYITLGIAQILKAHIALSFVLLYGSLFLFVMVSIVCYHKRSP